ncbi:putative Beta/gamma crystallin 'Greek key' domain-containing protein [Seiridium unicorne]|uniref:Beta/gamma crystallin 'Greek key' domain-containing protein n=1 Tax=Seiridium unicorne TaxID=138068 RepID=A0ABR2ULK9_9PEZI
MYAAVITVLGLAAAAIALPAPATKANANANATLTVQANGEVEIQICRDEHFRSCQPKYPVSFGVCHPVPWEDNDAIDSFYIHHRGIGPKPQCTFWTNIDCGGNAFKVNYDVDSVPAAFHDQFSSIECYAH